MRRDRHGLGATRAVPCSLLVIAIVAVAQGAAFASFPITSSPSLRLSRTIRTTPFLGSSVSMHDGEGSAFVPRDNSLWLADDNGRAVYEVNPVTGALKRVINRTQFEAAKKLGGTTVAGSNRPRDLESMAYDEATDSLYAFSGKCCTSSVLPTAFRLKRNGDGIFHVESYQPLPSGSDYTAAAWNPSDGKVYVGVGKALRTYDYLTGTPGPVFSVPNLYGILGLDFSSDGADLFAVTNKEKLHRVDWKSRKLVSGWTFDLTPFKVRDSRAVEVIGDQLFVLDGYDGRPKGDPLRYAVFVFDVLP